MSDRAIGNKQPRIKFLNSLPNIRAGKLGDMVVTSEIGGTFLGIKTKDEWKVTSLSSLGSDKSLKINTLDVGSQVNIRGGLAVRGDFRIPSDIYLRNSKIYFDMTEATPNDYITGGNNNLKFYANGVEQLELTTTEAQVAQTLVLSSDVKLPAANKIYLDGGIDTYITETSGNLFGLYVGDGLGGSANVLKASSSKVTVQTALDLESSTTEKPILTLKNTTADATGPYIKLLSQRGETAVDAVDNDIVGTIEFNGYDDGTPSTQNYANISGKIIDSGSGSEEGALLFSTAANNGTIYTGISLIGSSSSARADTTIHGNLTVNSVAEVGSDTDKILMSDSGVVKYVTGANLRSYIGAGTSSFGGALNDLSDVTYSSGDLTISSLDTIVTGTCVWDSSGEISLDHTDRFKFKKAGTEYIRFDVDGVSVIQMWEQGGASTDDYFAIFCATNGETTLQTIDAAAAAGHLNIEPDGHVEFDGCGVGFDLVAPTYNATNTVVDFKTGNKQFVTFGSGNITNIQFHFPATSGNFVVLLKQDGTGSRTVTNYKAYDSAGNAANGSSSTKFAGGSNPTLTTDANHVDIISIFWDADNEIAYAVPSLDFQF